MTTTATCGEIAGGMNQALEQTLALAASRDDPLRFVVVDSLICQSTCHIVSDETDVCLQV